MAEKGIFRQPFLFPEDVHHRDRIVKHPQGDIFSREGGKDGGLRVPVIDDRKGSHVVQVGVGDEDGLQLPFEPVIVRQAFQPEFFGMKTGIQKKGHAGKA